MILKTPGININEVLATSEPILFMTTSIEDLAVLELFLAAPKLNPAILNNLGYTALYDAVEQGHLGCVKLRVDSTIVNKNNETALDLQVSKYQIHTCQKEVAKHQQQMQSYSAKITM
ncbi:Ankyrin repeat protein [Legionella busanensis]|uniref:Ankyrin repeat protein n=1 Tax=Legionella busanensis TaxID=190655 RepID=A0A378JP57_9GAMM|nr:ankyrin repeat domain-containing protein [Legionella busanensis]STX52867.1 Ankyrin repeat protein [Legionella busanensis]